MPTWFQQMLAAKATKVKSASTIWVLQLVLILKINSSNTTTTAFTDKTLHQPDKWTQWQWSSKLKDLLVISILCTLRLVTITQEVISRMDSVRERSLVTVDSRARMRLLRNIWSLWTHRVVEMEQQHSLRLESKKYAINQTVKVEIKEMELHHNIIILWNKL